MRDSPFEIRRNRLAEAYILLIRAAESNTALGDILADEPSAATEATTQATRRVDSTAQRRVSKTGVSR